jgi:hypothetical protein
MQTSVDFSPGFLLCCIGRSINTVFLRFLFSNHQDHEETRRKKQMVKDISLRDLRALRGSNHINGLRKKRKNSVNRK